MKDKIVQWIADYFKTTASGDCKTIIGISGGKDSTIAAALCVEALGKERVIGVLMPQDVQDDIDVSYAVCEHLGIEFVEVNIGDTVAALYSAIPYKLNDVARFNTPARVRMTTLYAIAGMLNARVVNTCNASEIYVGWGTKFGDTAGDFSPLSNLTVTEVKTVGYELGLPAEFIEKIPIDGLCGKTDEEGLEFSYDELDRYINNNSDCEINNKAKIEKLHKQSEHKRNPIPSFNRGKI